MLIVSSIGVAFLISNDVKKDDSENAPARIAYTTHAPIAISGDAGFIVGTNGVTSGNGSATNPYIIEGWDIDASTATGISIMTANVHFEIRNCYIHGGVTNNYSGITTMLCTNATIKNNELNNMVNSFMDMLSSNIVVQDNIFSPPSMSFGCMMLLTNEFSITGNDFLSGAVDIYLFGATNGTLANNDMNEGILMYGRTMSGISPFCWTTQNISTSNTVNGKPVYYYKNAPYITINPVGAGQILVGNCTNATVKDQNVMDAVIGIEYGFCSNITITDCLLSNNSFGIWGQSSNNSMINWNTIQNNLGYGLYLENCNYSKVSFNYIAYSSSVAINITQGSWSLISDNTFVDNNGAGATYDANHIQTNDNGENNTWNLNYWSDWQTPDVVPPPGIVDIPYNISGTANSKDFSPLTSMPAIPEPAVIVLAIMMIGIFLMVRRKKT